MGLETWDSGPVNIWEPTTNRKVHLMGWGQEVRASNKAVTFLDIWDSPGNDDIAVGAVNTTLWGNAGNDIIKIESGINATLHLGEGFKDVSSGYLLGFVKIYEYLPAWQGPVWNTDRHIKVAASVLELFSGFGNDTVIGFGLLYVKIVDRGGNNHIEARGIGATVETGDGDDDIFVSAAGSSISSGDGNDHIRVEGLFAFVKDAWRLGNKHVSLGAAYTRVETGWGDDFVEIFALGASVWTGGGNDLIVVWAFGAVVDAGWGTVAVGYALMVA